MRETALQTSAWKECEDVLQVSEQTPEDHGDAVCAPAAHAGPPWSREIHLQAVDNPMLEQGQCTKAAVACESLCRSRLLAAAAAHGGEPVQEQVCEGLYTVGKIPHWSSEETWGRSKRDKILWNYCNLPLSLCAAQGKSQEWSWVCEGIGRGKMFSDFSFFFLLHTILLCC